eukprot:2574569-Prymnesium_polylepis.1
METQERKGGKGLSVRALLDDSLQQLSARATRRAEDDDFASERKSQACAEDRDAAKQHERVRQHQGTGVWLRRTRMSCRSDAEYCEKQTRQSQ